MLDHVFEKMDRIILFRIPVAGHVIEIGNTVFVTWIVMAILIVSAYFLTRKMSVNRPGKPQVVTEMLVKTVCNLCKQSIGSRGARFVPFIGTLLLYIGLSNIITLFNFIPGVHIYPPTKDINVTGALAAMSIIAVFYATFRYKGLSGWLKGLADPIPLMAPFKILEYGTKPLSLCLRLFGNIVAAFLIMELLLAFAPYIAAPFSIYFDLFDGILQAFIFVYLTAIYIGEAVE